MPLTNFYLIKIDFKIKINNKIMFILEKVRRARKTIIEMLNDRNFVIKHTDLTDNELETSYNEDNCKIVCKHKITKEEIMIIFYQSKSTNVSKIGVDIVKELTKKYKDESIKNMIFVLSNKLTHYALKDLKSNVDYNIEVFYINNIMFNIMHHEYMPKFTLLNETMQNKVIKRFGIHLPLIKLNDKVSEYYNAKVGQIFSIIRKNGSVYYRMVVN